MKDRFTCVPSSPERLDLCLSDNLLSFLSRFQVVQDRRISDLQYGECAVEVSRCCLLGRSGPREGSMVIFIYWLVLRL